MLSVGKVVVFLTGLLKYLAKNMALLIEHFGNFFFQNPFGYCKTKQRYGQ